MGISQLGGATSGTRLVTKANTVGQSFATATGISVANGGTSAWTTIIASTAADLLVVGAGFYFDNTGGSAAVAASIDIGYGGAGSEARVSQLFLATGNAASGWWPAGWGDLPIPPRIASGQRVAVRVAQVTSWSGSGNATVWLATVPYANLEGN